MYWKISCDVKLAAMNLFECNLLSLEQILECVGFSGRTFWPLSFEDLNYILHLVNHHPDWFLDKFLSLLDNNRFIAVHYTTIHCELAHAGISLKKLKKIAKERDPIRRADFVRWMAQYGTDEIGFIDETSKDKRTTARRYGRAKNGMVAISVVEGSFTTEKFKAFLREEVVSLFKLHQICLSDPVAAPVCSIPWETQCSRHG
ncbi:hypothetical protein PAXRUDRAFT_29911 [Paxillus rubicundulus Ve08.2h10]|uniref:Uncharacterized protein n=1 Tax=Paxillus rubicundulus Ve08.2h10 TaxID=930991 RepID=A0A0D0DXH1_9AGAM|nr:hypothetical protein PAXRUDRAFT_29911 [Paxillus rubicundulus Ve08.2h10]